MVAADGRASPWLDVDAILADPEVRIVVCCGAGGVGKTTTAAALALRAAEQHGRRTVVLTIDPARRLAQALGLTELDNTPRQVKGTNGAAGGELHAMMLDMKRTFDEVVLTHTDPKRAEEIFANPFYQAMSTTFAGTQEYMAMEKLGQLHARDEWDLIVVDTPPSRSALDFLDAPARLGRFLDGRMLRLLLAPARAGGRSGVHLAAAAALDGPAADVLRIHAALAAQVARETAVAARFTEEYPGVPVVPVAAQPADVHDLDGLREIGASLSAGQLPRRGG